MFLCIAKSTDGQLMIALSVRGIVMTPFELWMMSLDPIKLAARESFHSDAHRQAMELHELEKVRVHSQVSRVAEHEAFLSRVAELWELRDSKSDTPKTQPVPEGLSVRADRKPVKKMPVFTPEQIRIAQKVLEKKAK
jgi:hypothetical protein